MPETLTFEKVWQMFQETDRKFQDTDRKFQETDRKFQDTDRKFQETRREIEETSRMVKDLARRFGDLGNRLGEFVEGMVKPAAVRLFQQRGIAVHEVHSRTTITRDGQTIEIDLLVVNDTDLVAIECKSRLTLESVENHIAVLGKIKRLQPRYAAMNLYGAVAGIVIDTNAREFAEKSGLFVIAQSGDGVEIVNAPDFAPARF
jgi:hypothetical protein